MFPNQNFLNSRRRPGCLFHRPGPVSAARSQKPAAAPPFAMFAPAAPMPKLPSLYGEPSTVTTEPQISLAASLSIKSFEDIQLLAWALDPDAQFQLAQDYATGNGVPVNTGSAEFWLRSAARAGYLPAMTWLAGILLTNHTEDRDAMIGQGLEQPIDI